MTARRALQTLTAVLALIPLVTGVLTLMGVNDPLYAGLQLPPHPLLDTNLRFFGGVWLGLGLTVAWLVPQIERQTTLYRVLWGMIFLGGLGRLLSMASVGAPPLPFVAVTVLEIVGAPVFVLWQHRVARAALQGKARA
jgi:hypothetical protein